MSFVVNAAKKLVRKYKTNNPFDIAEYLNINVHFLPLHEEINGFYKLEKRNRFIIINKNLCQEMQRFVCAHELGHAVLHPRSNTPFLRKNTLFSIEKIEVEANTFAINLLLSYENLQDYETKFDILRKNGIPFEMEKLI